MMKTLIALVPLFVPATTGADTEYAELVAAFAAETEQYREGGGVVPALLPDVSPLHARFLAAAEQYEGSEASLPFLGWLLQNSPRNPDVHGAAVKAIDAMARELPKPAPADEMGAYEKSAKAVRLLKYETVSDVEFARTLLNAKALAHSADGRGIRASSAQSVFKLERLQEGMVAPDIIGGDLDGVEFALSDYRGKIVVIDFWGDW
jgi:hypothetical protein